MNAIDFLNYIEQHSVDKFTIIDADGSCLIDLSIIQDESIRKKIIIQAIDSHTNSTFNLE